MVRVLVGIICTLVVPHFEVSHGAASGISSGVCTLEGGVSWVGTALVKISASCLMAAVFLSPNDVSEIVGVGLKRKWVRSTSTCVAASFEDIIGNVSVARKFCSVRDSLFFRIGDVGR